MVKTLMLGAICVGCLVAFLVSGQGAFMTAALFIVGALVGSRAV